MHEIQQTYKINHIYDAKNKPKNNEKMIYENSIVFDSTNTWNRGCPQIRVNDIK